MVKKDGQNLLTLRPKWSRDWDKTTSNLTVIRVPKFGNHLFGNWIMKKLKNPYYSLKLDEVGTFVWEHCNGLENVREIGEKLKKKYGKKVEPVYDRLGIFFKHLEKSKSITWV